MKIHLRALVLFGLCGALLLSLGEPAAAVEAHNGETYVIRSVSYEIDGRTRPAVLAHRLDIEEERRFETRTMLEVYLEDKEQLLANQRTLANGTILPSYEQSSTEAEVVYVDLEVRVEDTWNLILLPYGKYDSNEGLEISLKGRDFNFLGRMNEIALNFDYLIRDWAQDSERSGYDFTLYNSFELPFYAYGLDWHVGFTGDLTYNTPETLDVTQSGAPLQANTTFTFGLDIPLEYQRWETELIQEYHLNEEGFDDPDGYYYRTTLRFGSSIPTGLELPFSDEITYSPYLFTGFSYKPGDVLSEERRGYEAGFQNSLSAGRVDWMGNFRSGNKAVLESTLKRNFTRARWLGSASAEYQYHNEWGWGGVSSRTGFFYRYGSVKEEAGDTIRGILDRRVHGNLGAYTNLAFPTRMWIGFLDRWFEGHVSPFFDYAVVRPEGDSFDLRDAWYGAGVEGFAYAKFARSLYLRLSFGVDVEAMLEGGGLSTPAERDGGAPYEIFIGLGHHY